MVAIVVLLSAHAAPPLLYSTAVVDGSALDGVSYEALARDVDGTLRGEGIEVAWSQEPTRAMWAAAWMARTRRHERLECDLVVPEQDGRPRLITVIADAPDRFTVQAGPIAEGGLLPTPPAAEALRTRFGLAGIEGRWEGRSLAAVQVALEALSDAERALLTDLSWIRTTAEATGEGAPGPGWRHAAAYQSGGSDHSIQLYSAPSEQPSHFCGPLDAPQHPAVHTLLHEVAHAIADAPRRSAQAAIDERRRTLDAEATRLNQENEDIRRAIDAENAAPTDAGRAAIESRIRAHDRAQATYGDAIAELRRDRAELDTLERAVDRAWDARFGHRGPTPYGRSDAHESYAEAFALHKLDPAALDRTTPGANTWFAEGHHLPGR